MGGIVNLLLHGASLRPAEAEELIQDYHRLIKLTVPELVPYPSSDLVRSSRHLIRQEPDVAVLLSAISSQPDWLLTHNTKHFTKSVARRVSIQIAAPAEFFKALSGALE